jgi:hypothetical protein
MQTCGHAVLGDCDIASRATKVGPRILFVHIPRSGGSNLWHSSAQSFFAADRSIHILDIYHESLVRYGTIHETTRTIKDLDLASFDRCLVHLHTSFGLWRLLEGDFTYFTILRDPVERAISYYFQSLNRHYNVDMEKRVYSPKQLNTKNAPLDLGDRTLEPLIRISKRHDLLSPEAIIRFIADGAGSNFYINFMRRYFEIEGEHDFCKPSRFPRFKVRALAEKMKQHFTHVFFSVEDAFAFLENSFGHKIAQRNWMPNQAPRPLIENPRRLRRRLLPYLKHDYRLMQLLGYTAPSP